MSKLINAIMQLLTELSWFSAKDTWTPPEGFFTQSAKKIAAGLKDNSKDLKQATSHLNLYRNKAGKNISEKNKARLDTVVKNLENLYK